MAEIETNLKLKCLRSDIGGTYIDGGFKEYCAVYGIKMGRLLPGPHNKMMYLKYEQDHQ